MNIIQNFNRKIWREETTLESKARRKKDNIKIYLKEGVELIQLVQDKFLWAQTWATGLHNTQGISWRAEQLSASQELAFSVQLTSITMN
jgi:glucose/arabinose dehydrogenase